MPIGFKRAYLLEINERYRNASRKQKTAILDEFCRVYGCSLRKHAIEILRSPAIDSKRTGPKPKYLEGESSRYGARTRVVDRRAWFNFAHGLRSSCRHFKQTC